MAQGFYYGDSDRKSIERQRALLDALGSKPIAPQGQMVGGQFVSSGWAGALAEALGGAMRGYGHAELDKQSKAMDEKEQSDAMQFFRDIPRGKPEVPMQPGTLPQTIPAQTTPQLDKFGEDANPELTIPGQEPVLGTPAQRATPDERLAHATRGLGNRMTAGYAGKVLEDFADPIKVVGNDAFDKVNQTWMEGSPTAKEAVAQRQLQAQLVHEAKLEQIRTSAATEREKMEATATAKREHDETLKEIARIRAEAAGGGRAAAAERRQEAADARLANVKDFGIAQDGERIFINAQGLTVKIKPGADGKPIQTPYDGPVTRSTEAEDQMKKARPVLRGMENIARAEFLAGKPENKDAFGPSGFLGAIPFVGPSIDDLQYTPTQLETRASVAKIASEAIHDIYGAALTRVENAKALPWAPNANDPPKLVFSKLKQAKEWAQTHLDSYDPGVLAAIKGRKSAGGGAPAPAPGGKTVVKKVERNGKTHVLYSDGSEGVL